MRSFISILAPLLCAAQTQTTCKSPNGMDLVFVLDESGSVGHTDFNLAKNFVKDVVKRFDVGAGTADTRVAWVSFAHASRIIFNLYEHETSADVENAIGAAPFSGGGTCTGLAMRMVEDDILGSANAPAGKAYRPNANHIVVFITDGNPSQISYCDKDYSFSTGYSYKREDLIKSLKAKATRIVPVGVGKGISSAFLSSLSHNMPSHAVINGVNTALPDFVRVDGGYTQMNALLDTIATVACPTAPPTAPAPTFAPTTAMPTTSPTFSCTATCTKDYQENACDMTNGFCYYHTTACAPADRRCGCNGNMLPNAGTGLCTSAPTASPTTASPSTAPTNTPTFAPSTPTKEPTYWVLFNDGTASQDEAVAVTAATAAGVGLGAFAIVAIVLGVIALIVLLAMIAGGVGIFAVRKKLFGVDMTVDGKNLQKGNAITVGSKIEMTESTAKGMLARGEVTPEQFAEMGFTVGDGGETLPGYAESVQ